jgi:FlaA1/EpsC-like NDP-sugar epimerase
MVRENDRIDKQWLRRAIIIGVLDVLCVAGSFFMALLVRFDFSFQAIPRPYLETYMRIILPWIGISIVVFMLFHMYSSIWTFVGVDELFRMIVAHGVLLILGCGGVALFKIDMPKSFYFAGFIMSFITTAGLRFSYRFIRQLRGITGRRGAGGTENIMIIGAGAACRSLIREFYSSVKLNSHVACIIDDNPGKKNRYLEGVKVVGNRHDIPEAVTKYRIDKIIYAIPSSSAKTRKEILDICNTTGCKIQVTPGIYQLVKGEIKVSELRDVELQDLLGREPIKVNLDEIFRYISGKVVMVTGGGGSIGSELCRQVAKSRPKQLIIFDIYENNAYDIQMELRRTCPELNLEVLIGSVRNTARLEYIMKKYRPDIVFHAAAHKHVPLMEDSPNEAIKNNVFGTYKTAQAAAKYGVKKFVLISTDKAVNPTNIMGASKRLCEMVIQMMSRRGTDTTFVAVRFGNVLGSNGSVIPLFKKQIAQGGPVTVTHPDITRFFMTIPEAVSLVLQAGYYARGGEIFVLDMGKPVKIDTMARNLIRLSGYEPDVDIKVEYTGLRPGEKLYEELLMNEEGLQKTENRLIYVGQPIVMDDEKFSEQLKRLSEAYKTEAENIKDIVAEIVPTYKREL